MGTWGSGSFENDTALDWAQGVQSIDDVRAPLERFEHFKAEQAKGRDLALDADFAAELVAAAEAVALMMGRRGRDVPEQLAIRLRDVGKPEPDLHGMARSALLHVMRHSELAVLWQAEIADGSPNEWLGEITRLLDRLNPDVEQTPWEPEAIKRVSGPVPQPCAFCDQPVNPNELFMMTIFDASTKAGGDRGFWLHLPCLNARMHHKHAIANLKFDVKNESLR